MSRWPTFVSMKIGESARISYLLHTGRDGWCDDHVAQLFGLDLTNKVLAIAVLTHDARDMRVWISFNGQRVKVKVLYVMFCETSPWRLDIAWI